MPHTKETADHLSDLRDAFVTVKRDFLKQTTQENVNLRQTNQSIKMQNSQLVSQIDKLKRLCHLCLNLIMTSNSAGALAPPSPTGTSPSTHQTATSTTTATTTNVTDHHLELHNNQDHHGNEHQPCEKNLSFDDEIDMLILEYLYSDENSAENSHKLVKHFDEMMSRLVMAGASSSGGGSGDGESAKSSNELLPCAVQNKRKSSFIKRLVKSLSVHVNQHHHESPHHQNGHLASPTAAVGATRKTSTVTQPTTIPPVSSMCSIASSAAAAAAHLRPCDSIQKLHEFFECQQENQRVILGGVAEECASDEQSQKTVTNAFHLAVAPIKAMNGGVGSPTKSMCATEEHSGTQLSPHIVVHEIVDTAPKMSEVAMFCGLNDDNPGTNMMLNYAIRKEKEKRQFKEAIARMKAEAKAKEEKEAAEAAAAAPASPSQAENLAAFLEAGYVSPYASPSMEKSNRPKFEIGLEDDTEEEEDQESAPDSVVDCDSSSHASSEETMDMEQEMDRLLEHIQKHRWFILPTDSSVTNPCLLAQLNAEVFDLNNVESAFQVINRLWSSRKAGNTRIQFFYEMFQFLFDKYLNVVYCDCHQPPCAPSVEASLFGKLAIEILRRFLECVNRNRHLIIQIELLTSIESLVYNRPHYRPALSEVFHYLFTSGLIEATAFVEWAKLDDPSALFEAAQPKKPASISPPPATIHQRSASKDSIKSMSKSSKQPPKSPLPSPTAASSNPFTNTTSKNSPPPQPESTTSRDRLFHELKKAGFSIFKCKYSF